jgi:hypothetical protein
MEITVAAMNVVNAVLQEVADFWTHSSDYLTNTEVISEVIKSALVNHSLQLGNAAVVIVRSLVILILYSSVILCKLLYVIFPYIVTMTKMVVEFHRTQLSWTEILLEVATISALIFWLTFRKRIKTAWKNIEKQIAAKSKVAAKAAPHVLFFTAATCFAVLGQNFLVHLASPEMLPLFTLVFPLLMTLRCDGILSH